MFFHVHKSAKWSIFWVQTCYLLKCRKIFRHKICRNNKPIKHLKSWPIQRRLRIRLNQPSNVQKINNKENLNDQVTFRINFECKNGCKNQINPDHRDFGIFVIFGIFRVFEILQSSSKLKIPKKSHLEKISSRRQL